MLIYIPTQMQNKQTRIHAHFFLGKKQTNTNTRTHTQNAHACMHTCTSVLHCVANAFSFIFNSSCRNIRNATSYHLFSRHCADFAVVRVRVQKKHAHAQNKQQTRTKQTNKQTRTKQTNTHKTNMNTTKRMYYMFQTIYQK